VEAIFNNMRLLNDDAIGGNVSRGYGRIKLKDLCIRYRPLDYYRKGIQEIIMEQKDAEFNDFMLQVIERLAS